METPDEVSPYSLIQEELWRDRPPDWEWRVLVVCCLMNLATAKKAREVMVPLFTRWPTALHMKDVDLIQLSDVVRPLGLQSRRAQNLKNMAQDYVDGKRANQCRGVGEYAQHSWTLFVERKMLHLDVLRDKELRNVALWAQTKGATT